MGIWCAVRVIHRLSISRANLLLGGSKPTIVLIHFWVLHLKGVGLPNTMLWEGNSTPALSSWDIAACFHGWVVYPVELPKDVQNSRQSVPTPANYSSHSKKQHYQASGDIRECQKTSSRTFFSFLQCNLLLGTPLFHFALCYRVHQGYLTFIGPGLGDGFPVMIMIVDDLLKHPS